jgi:hypothetical protein
MSEAATKLKRPTLKSLAAEMRRLRERLEDVEDLIELRSAIERNAGRPGVPWEKVKTDLDLDWSGIETQESQKSDCDSDNE